MKTKYKFLIVSLALSFNLFSEEKDEAAELLYQKLSELEKEIAELRSQLEENSILNVSNKNLESEIAQKHSKICVFWGETANAKMDL